MKKNAFLMMAAAAGLASCTSTPKAELKTDVDTLSYMIGVSNTQGLKDYVVGRMGVDTAYYADFIKGVAEGINDSDKKKAAHIVGFQIGQQVSGDMYNAINSQVFEGDSALSISKENFVAGFIDAINDNAKATTDSAAHYTQTKVEEIKNKAMEAKYGEYKQENADFLTKNKDKEGIQVTASGLQYRIIKKGNGKVPTATSRVKVHYKGTLIDGTVFDSSYERKEPTSFMANQVIKGWTEALTMMPVGSKWELYIPQELAYGSREAGKIKPFSTLIFEVELLSIEK